MTTSLRSMRFFVISWLLTVASIVWPQLSSAYSYNYYDVDDLNITHSNTAIGGTDSLTVTFTIPDDITTGISTSGYLYLSSPYLYRYVDGSYSYDYVDLSSATISSNQVTSSSPSTTYVSLTPKSTLAAGSTVTLTLTGVKNPATLEGTGSFSVYGYDYNSSTDVYNSFWGSTSQAYGTVDLTVTMNDANGTTPISNVGVYLSYYNPSNYSDYEYHYGYTNTSGQVQFAGLTTNRSYTISYYYYGTATDNDPPTSTTVTFSGTATSVSYNFVSANVLTHWLDTSGNAIDDAYWYFYKTDYTNYYTDYVWRYGYTDSAGTIKGAAQLDGSYTLYVQDPDSYNYSSYSFTVSNGVESGLADPIRLTGPEVTGTITANGSGVNDAYVWMHDNQWSQWKSDYTDSNGDFEFSLDASGEYTLEVSSYNLPSGYFAPDTLEVSVTDGIANNPLKLELEAATKTIGGSVTMTGNSVAGIAANTPVTDATVYAYQSSGSYRYIYDQTDSNGNYSLPVLGGKWIVAVYQNSWPATWAYTGDTETVSFNDDSTSETSTVNFKATPYDAHITARLLFPDGTPVAANALYGYAYGGENNRVYSYAYTNDDGELDLNVTEGSFQLYFYLYNSSGTSNHYVPQFDVQTVAAGETLDLGEVTLLEKTSHIQGHITIEDTGEAVANQYVSAYLKEGWGWESAQTDSNGFYDLLVAGPAEWTVNTYTYGLTTSSGQNILYSGGGKTVSLSEAETVTGVDFVFNVADAEIAVQTTDSEGNDRSDEYGWFSLSEAGAEWSNVGCYVSRGVCSVDVASAVEYTPNFYSYSNWNWHDDDEDSYSFSHVTVDGVQQNTVTVASGAVAEVAVVLTVNDAVITGEFQDNDGNPTKVTAYVYASGDKSRWVSTFVDNESSYTLKVAPGTYDVSYWVYGDWMSSYKKSQEVTVGSGDTETLNFAVLDDDATISGVVNDPDGNPVTTPVFVKASTSYGKNETATGEKYGLVEQTTYTGEDGTFSMTVPSGTYFLTASSPDYLSPQPIEVAPTKSNKAQDIVLTFVAADVKIRGTVTDGVGIEVNSHRIQAVGDPVAEVYVYGYCVNGSYTDTTTDSSGEYSLSVPANDTCFVGAVEQVTGAAYYSNQAEVTVKKKDLTQDLILENTLEVPEAQTVQFDPQDGTVVTLSNGVRVEVPANAITVEDINEVRLTVTPAVKLVHQPGLEPLSIGYELTATDDQGNPISQFAGEVKIIIPYLEEDLSAAGVDEGDLQVNYHEAAAGSWQAVDGGVIKNKDENQFEISVKHFSTFAVVTSRSVLQTDSDTDDSDSGDSDDGDDSDGSDDSTDNMTVEQGILSAPKKVTIKKHGEHSVIVRWSEVAVAAKYQIEVRNTKTHKVLAMQHTKKQQVLVKGLSTKVRYKIVVRSVGSTGSKSGWSTAATVKLGGKATKI